MHHRQSFNISLQAVCLHVCQTGRELNSVVQKNTKLPNRGEFTLLLPMNVVCLLSCFKTLKTSIKLFFHSIVLSIEISSKNNTEIKVRHHSKIFFLTLIIFSHLKLTFFLNENNLLYYFVKIALTMACQLPAAMCLKYSGAVKNI